MRQSMRLCVTNICALYRLMHRNLCLASLRIFLRIFRFGFFIYSKAKFRSISWHSNIFFLSISPYDTNYLHVKESITFHATFFYIIYCVISVYAIIYIIYIYICNLLRLKFLSSLTFYFPENLFNRMKSQYITRINLITRIS